MRQTFAPSPGATEPTAKLRGRLDAYMASRGMRSTAQRRLIVDTFLQGAPHTSIEELLAAVRERDKGIGYATVYRTLKLLAEAGVASERRFGDGLSRYEIAEDDESHHDHVICDECGHIFEFEEPRIEALQDEVAARMGFRIRTHKLELYGVCTDANCTRRPGT
jgi:Fur family ferric uptake transcriptional regulator